MAIECNKCVGKCRCPRKSALKKTGSNRMTEMGYSPVQIWLDATAKHLLQQAAAAEHRHLTQFMLYHSTVAAEKRMNGKRKGADRVD